MLLMDFLANEYGAVELVNPEKLAGSTVLVTGSNGLLGSNFVNFLQFLHLRHAMNINILAHSFSQPVSWLPRGANIQYFSSDLNDHIPTWKFDYLINTATYGQPKKFLVRKLETIQLNTGTFARLLELAQRNNASVLQMSSIEVYGKVPSDSQAVTEEYSGDVNTFDPRSPYAEAKRVSETIAKVFIDAGMNIKLARLAIGYGPGIKYDDNRFYSEFIKKALDFSKIVMLDAGSAVRQLSFVSDTIEMLMNILLSGRQNIYNVGGVDIKRVNEFANIIGDIMDVEVLVPEKENSVGGQVKDLTLDISRYINEFGLPKFIDARTGLSKTAEWLSLIRKIH